MEKLNLVELLRDAPKGTKLYSPIFSECELEKITVDTICVTVKGGSTKIFYEDGTYDSLGDECLLFPSKENRDWSTFKIEKEDFQVGDYVKVKSSGKVYLIKQIKETIVFVSDIINSSNDFEFPIDKSIISEKVTKFDPKWLKPFDRVLVRDKNNIWVPGLFSYFKSEHYYPFVVIGQIAYQYCIPYNEETKNLIRTTNTEPEFYKI